ncbi:MAG: DUF3467 domain-containing protein [Sulfuritalea sp.]|nr:DUF3467 domain-containing protein [Sulfuritalea sp.]
MAKSNTGEAAAAATTKSEPDVQKVVWDDTRMNTSYSNVCNVLGSREEITLLFGANQAWHSGQKEVKVLLSDRIVLNPYAAKRLAGLLDRVLKEYEARYGQLKLEA